MAILNHPLTDALARSLAHFLWQGALLAALLLLLNSLIGPARARLRYAAACLTMLAMPVCFVATVLLETGFQRYPASGEPVPQLWSRLPPLAPPAILPAGVLPANASAPIFIQLDLSGWAVCLWLAGVLALALYSAAGWLRVRRLQRQPSEPLNPAWIEMLESLKVRLRISRPVRICATLAGEVPAVMGWFRPVILLPLTAITGLDESQLRAILAHELAHVRRHDYVINLLQSFVETLLFYHPVVWWVGRQIRREREHCADDLAVAACGDVMVYAGALTRLEELRSLMPGSMPHPALGASGGDLLERIRRLTGQPRRRARVARPLGAIAAALLIVVIAAVPMLRSVNAAPQNPAPAPTAAEAPASENQNAPALKPEPAPNPEPAPSKPLAIAEQAPGAHAGQGGGYGGGQGIGQGVGNGIGLEIQRDVAALDERLRVQMDELTQAMDQLRQSRAEQNRAAAQAAQAQVLAAQAQAVQAQASQARAGAKPASTRNVDPLIALFDKYEAAGDLEDARIVLGYLADSDNPKAAAKIASVARGDSHLELRRIAISHLAGQGQSFDAMVSIYDHETNVQVKQTILSQIAESSDSRAEQKLFDVAQSDPSPELRRTAIALLAER